MTFEDYLQQKHADQAECILDDDMPEDYDNWLCELEPEELIKHAEEWGNFRYMEGKVAAYNHSMEIIERTKI